MQKTIFCNAICRVLRRGWQRRRKSLNISNNHEQDKKTAQELFTESHFFVLLPETGLRKH